jgi:hypothetical protein
MNPRGVEKVAAESGFVCIVHYIVKLTQGWTLPEARLGITAAGRPTQHRTAQAAVPRFKSSR